VPVKQISSVEVGFDREFIEKWLDRQKYVWYSIILLLAVTLAGLLGRAAHSERELCPPARVNLALLMSRLRITGCLPQ
jgi:sensor histidine kinase regulating citrate/malate metabolism